MRWTKLAAGLALATGLAGPAEAADAPTARLGALPGLERVLFDSIEYSGEQVVLRGNVEITARRARVVADLVRYRPESRSLEATGSVVLSFPGAVLIGSHLAYDIESETGEIENAVGYLEEDGAILRADRIARVGPERLRVEGAVFTTCTQPVPYWSFRIARGTFDLGEYAYLRGVAFKAGRVPVFYAPYLAWPIKTDRAPGLLFPEFNSSDKLGETLTLPVYWPFARNAEATFLLEWHSRVGLGLGALVEWLPTWRGAAEGDFRWINDEVRRQDRWSVEWEQNQELGRDYRLTSSLELVSDFDYLTDYETDLRRAASPNTRSRIDLTRNWSWYSLSMRTVRDEQFFVGGLGLTRFLTGKVVNTQLPEIELRGRSQRLGRSPVYLSFQSSASGFQKRILEPPPGQATAATDEDLVTRAKSEWARADLAPLLQVPVVRLPWLDLQLTGGWRGTWYSARPDALDPQAVRSDPIFRSLWNAGLSLSGPRFQRVFETPDWDFSPRLKHVIEPFLLYQWRPEANTEPGETIVFDELDAIPGRLGDVTYGIRQRLFVLRSAATDRPTSLAAAGEVSFRGLEELDQRSAQLDEIAAGSGGAVVPDEDDGAAAAAAAVPLNPIEMLSFEVFQRYSFVRPLSSTYAVLTDPATGEDVVDPVTGRPQTAVIDTRRASPVTARLRFNPTTQNSLDVSYVFDPANRKLTETAISATLRDPGKSYFRGSWFRRQPSNPAFSDESSFLRGSWGIAGGSRFRFETDIDFDLEASKLDHQAYTVSYATQCCSFSLGYDRRDFVDNTRRELLLVIDLQGLGEILKLRDSQSD